MLNHKIEAHPLGSWLTFEITTMGRDVVWKGDRRKHVRLSCIPAEVLLYSTLKPVSILIPCLYRFNCHHKWQRKLIPSLSFDIPQGLLLSQAGTAVSQNSGSEVLLSRWEDPLKKEKIRKPFRDWKSLEGRGRDLLWENPFLWSCLFWDTPCSGLQRWFTAHS